MFILSIIENLFFHRILCFFRITKTIFKPNVNTHKFMKKNLCDVSFLKLIWYNHISID